MIVVDAGLAYQVGDEHGVLAAGGLLWFPRAVPHAVATLSGRACRFLTVVTPAGIEAFFGAQRTTSGRCHPARPPIQKGSARCPRRVHRPMVGPPLIGGDPAKRPLE